MAGPMQAFDVKPPRPRNSWILYRAHMLRNLPPVGPGEPRRSQSDVSSLISYMWRNETEEVRAHFERLADEAKAEHRRRFPNYKFQPRKKAEKDRLKELEKQQKPQKRDARSRRGVESGSSSRTPAPPSLRPNAPYYVPNMLYGPAGPTPPLSAASSPSDATPSSPGPSGFVSIHRRATPGVSTALSFPTVHPPRSPVSSADEAPIASLPFPFQLLQPAAPVDIDQTSTLHETEPTLHSQVSPELNYIGSTLPLTWNDSSLAVTESAAVPTTLYFDIGASNLNQMHSWTQDSDPQFLNSFQGLLSDNRGLFEIQDFDHNAIASNPQGEIEVSVGNLDQSQDVSSFMGLSFFDPESQQGFLSHYAHSYSPQVDFSFLDEIGIPFGDGQYSNSDTLALSPTNALSNNVSVEPIAHAEFDSQRSDAPVATSSSYVPPSGAAYSSSRRVGANWANTIFARDNTLDRRSSQQEVSAQ